MRPATGALALALLSAGPSRAGTPAARGPLAVLWLDGPNDAVPAVDAALAAAPELTPLGDPEARRVLLEGGPASRIAARVEAARGHLAAQRFREADGVLAGAEAIALGELTVGDARARLGEIEPLRLSCADFLRDEPAARRAARLVTLSGVAQTEDLAAAVARHPEPAVSAGGGRASPSNAPAARVESDPPGAEVYVDLQSIGRAPIALPPSRRAAAMIDVEAPGYRKIHRASAGAGTLAVTLAREDPLGARVDRVRAARGSASAEELAPDLQEIGRRVGAARILVLRRTPEKSGWLDARVFDVTPGKWIRAPLGLALAELSPRLGAYAGAGPEPSAPSGKGGVAAIPSPAAAAAATVAKPAAPVPAWKRWYTWVAGGVLLGGVVALVVIYHVGSDQVTLTTHYP